MAGHRLRQGPDRISYWLSWRTVALVLGLILVSQKVLHSYNQLKLQRATVGDGEEGFLSLESPLPHEDEKHKERDCKITLTYVPAAWEEDFVANMSKYQEGGLRNLCRPIKKYKPLVDRWMTLWQHINEKGWKDLPSWSKSTFSYFRRTVKCEKQGTRSTIDVPIEPLVSFLRHPLYLCFSSTEQYRVNKDYMLLAHPGLTNAGSKRIKKYMFDAGASSYRKGAGGASTSWFIETYRKNGVEFDDMFCWEAQGNQQQLLREYPFDILLKTHYFVVPVSARKDAFHNILNWIRYKATEEDFVVFKLDIDTPEVESALAEQLLNPEIAKLVDEFFFEDHVSKSPMEDHGWSHVAKHHDLAHSIVYFQKLRKLGIRAHSWV